MSSERICGDCVFGREAYDRFGNYDPNYVMCQIKEAELRQRKPNQIHTTSGVARMHYYREACLHWKPDLARELSRPPMEAAPAQQVAGETPLETLPTSSVKVAAPPTVEEMNELKLKLIQQDQMISSLQNQNMHLSERMGEVQAELESTKQQLNKLKPFDPAIFSEVNYFSLLGVSEDASSEEIKDAYRQRMKYLHPDRYINLSQRLNTAYETLMNEQKKRQYLKQLRAEI